MDMRKRVIETVLLPLCLSIGCQSTNTNKIIDRSLTVQQITIIETHHIPVFGNETLTIQKFIYCWVHGREDTKVRYDLLVQWGFVSSQKKRDKFLYETDDGISVPTETLFAAMEKYVKRENHFTQKQTNGGLTQDVFILYSNLNTIFFEKEPKSNLSVDFDNLWTELMVNRETNGDDI